MIGIKLGTRAIKPPLIDVNIIDMMYEDYKHQNPQRFGLTRDQIFRRGIDHQVLTNHVGLHITARYTRGNFREVR